MDDPNLYLSPGRYVDSDAPQVVAFSREICGSETDVLTKALRLYSAVRDGIAYTPYFDFRSEDIYRASTCLDRKAGFCVAKAALLAATARVAGIPARVGYADVRNHLSTRKLRALMGTDIFYYHSYADLFLNGKWVKATPAFDRRLCDRFGVGTLEFDGRHDSLMQPYNESGRRHMEYVHYRGTFADVPVADIMTTFLHEYPNYGREAAEVAAAESRARAAQPLRAKRRVT
jgi:hypothetical protein